MWKVIRQESSGSVGNVNAGDVGWRYSRSFSRFVQDLAAAHANVNKSQVVCLKRKTMEEEHPSGWQYSLSD